MLRTLIPVVLAAGALAAPAQAAYQHRHLPVASLAHALPGASPETVVQDDATFLHGGDRIAEAIERTKALGVQRIRVTAGWSVIAPDPDAAVRPEFDDTDPGAYPVGNWMNLDRIVRMADAAGLRVMIDIAFWAPRWATRSDPSEQQRLRTDIDPVLYAHFAQAVATRYSGSWAPAPLPADVPVPQPEPSPDGDLLSKLLGGGRHRSATRQGPTVAEPSAPLPAVDIFTIWNEPNHPGFLKPIWTRENGRLVPHAADVYRAMVMAAYPAIKAAAPASRVLIGATAPAGASETGRSGVTPLRFIRRLACVDGRYRPIHTGPCAGFTTIPGDGWAHHAYSLWTLPDQLPIDGDKLPVAATGRLLGVLQRLVDAGRLAPGNRDLYVTEYGYETSPPDPRAPFGPDRQAQLLSWAEFIATRSPRVRMWPNFQLIDRPGDVPYGNVNRPFADWQTGLYYADWTPKPAAAVYRTPTFAGCLRRNGRTEVLVWGRIRDPVRAAVTLDRTVPGMTTRRVVAHVSQVAGGREVLRYARYQAGARYRLSWSVGGQPVEGPAVAPVQCPAR